MIQKVKNFVAYLRNKPEGVKKIILYVAVAICSVVVFVLWTLSWKTPFEHLKEGQKSIARKERSLLQDLWRSLKSTVNPAFEAKNTFSQDFKKE